MKTAISIPEPIFKSAEQLAQRLGMSRSELYARAVSEMVDKHLDDRVTERLNAVYGSEDSSLDTGLARLQYETQKKRGR